LIRLTLHAVLAEDYPPFHNAMVSSLRASRLNDRRYTSTGLTRADADSVVPDLLKFAARPRSKAEIEDRLETQTGERQPRMWWALRTFAPLHHAPTGRPWAFGTRSAYMAAGIEPRSESSDDAAQKLVRRYLEGFGPAGVLDFAQFTMLRRPVVTQALRALADRGEVEELEGPGGGTLFDIPGGLLPAEKTPAPPRLLPMWDSILLAYADRSRVIPPDYRRLIIHQNGDVLPTLLVDGFVAGVWRPVDGGIEATAFERLSEEAWGGLEAEAGGLLTFLATRDPNVYRRYGHWWDKHLPSAEVRLLKLESSSRGSTRR
jgi:Winged helix DNA-binding domain